MEKSLNKEKFMDKNKYALVIGILIGLIIGITSTYIFMKNIEYKKEENYKKEKLTITEKMELEIKKLSLKNRTYTYVDDIEKEIEKYNSKSKEEKIKGTMFALENDKFYQVDSKTIEKIENGINFSVKFTDMSPINHTVIIINEKGLIEEAIFLVEDNFQIKYNLIGTEVSKLED